MQRGLTLWVPGRSGRRFLGTVQHMALDGGVVTVDSNLDLTQRAVSFVTFEEGTHRQRFASGPLDWGREVAHELQMALDEEYGFQGGRLRVGKRTIFDIDTQLDYKMILGVWEGANYALKTTLYHVDTPGLLDLLGRFAVGEGPLGLNLAPQDPTEIKLQRRLRAPKVLKNVPGFGMLEVRQLTQEQIGRLPTWGGAEVAGGELFREDGEERTFLLLGSSSITRVYPNWWETTEAEMLAHLSTLRVEWR